MPQALAVIGLVDQVFRREAMLPRKTSMYRNRPSDTLQGVQVEINREIAPEN